MKEFIVCIIMLIIIGIVMLIAAKPRLDCGMQFTTQRLALIEKNLEVEQLTRDLLLLKYSIDTFKTLSETQKKELTKLHNFITTVGGQGGEPTL